MADKQTNPHVPAGVDPKAVTPITPPELIQAPKAAPQVKEPTDLPAVTQAERDHYDQLQRDKEGVVKHTLDSAKETSPDSEAQVADIARRRGVPVDYARRNLDHFKKLDWQEKAPVRKVTQQTPELAQWLTEKNNANVAHDDLDKLAGIEWFLKAYPRALSQGIEQMRVAQLRVKEMASIAAGGKGLSQEDKDQLNASAFHMNEGGELGADSWYSGAVTGLFRLAPNIAASLVAAKGGAMIGGRVGAVAGPEGAAAGALVGGGIAAFGVGASLEAGLGYHELVQEVDDEGKPYDQSVALGGALVIGAINGGIEVAQLEKLAAAIPGLDKLTRQGARDAVRLALKNPTVRDAIKKTVTTYGSTLAFESGTEGLQRLTNIMVDEVGKAVQSMDGKKKFETGPNRFRTPAEIGLEVVNEIAEAAQSMALVPLPGAVAQTRANLQAVQTGKANAEFFKALGEGVTQAKTVERAPAQAAEFISRIVKDGPVENVYIPTDTFTTYWQSQNIDPREMATELTGDPAAYDEALRDKVDLIVPMERYATKLAPTEHQQFFQDEIRLQEGQYNGREAKAFEGEVENKLKELEEATKLAGDALAEQPAVQEHGQVYDQMRQQLEGIVGPKLADGYAKLHEAFFGTMATRAGVGIRSIFDRYSLQVGRQGITPGVEQRVSGSAFTQPDYADLRNQALQGGFTFAPLDETQPTQGFAVSAFPGRELAVNADSLTELTIQDFIAKNSDALSQKGAHIGAWFNQEDGKVYLDVSMVADTAEAADAIAREHQQLAYYDLGKGETVNVQSRQDINRFQADAALAAGGGIPGTGAEVRPTAQGQFYKKEPAQVIGGLDAAPAERVDGALVISTRYLKAATTRTVADSMLDTRASLYFENKEKLAQAAATFRSYNLLTKAELKKAKTDEQVVRASIDAMKRNLKALLDEYPKEWAERARHWYIGANRIANEMSEAHGVTVDQASGVLAALSPQMDWYRNVSLATRVLTLTKQFEVENPTFSQEMFDLFEKKMRGGIETWIRQNDLDESEADAYRKKKEEDIEEARVMVGQSWSSTDIEGKARILRAWDELYNERTYNIISPEGDQPGLVMNKPQVRTLKKQPLRELPAGVTVTEFEENGEKRFRVEEAGKKPKVLKRDPRAALLSEEETVREVFGEDGTMAYEVTRPGEPGRLGWSTYKFIGNAISITLDGSAANIHESLGTEHKVRSFYNNISNPFDRRSVTIDTHAVAAAFLQPFAGTAKPVMHTMGTKPQGDKTPVPQDATTGASGTNPIVAEAYFELAEELGIQPRELQSITWEAVRSLFRPEQKRSAYGKALQVKTLEVLQSYGDGKLKHGDAFRQILNAAGGFEKPSWQEHQVSEQGALAAASVRPRQPAVAAAAGDSQRRSGRPTWGDSYEPDGVIRGVVAGAPRSSLTQLYQSAFHGASRQFEKFSLAFSGTGEGQQKFGWGLYFAGRRELAEHYRDFLTEKTGQEGRVFEVQIPDEQMYVNWDAPLGSQSREVREATTALLGQENPGITGEQFYRELVARWQRDVPGASLDDARKAASIQIASKGLAGLKFQDAATRLSGDTPNYNYVVVDDNLIQIQRYYQGARGALTIGAQAGNERSMNIDLLKSADPTTFFHESGHLFFEVMGDIVDSILAAGPKTPEQAKILADYNTLLAFTGVESREAFKGLSPEGVRSAHEKIAEAFEDWLMKGNAPSVELRSLFSRMRAWFIGVYKAVRQSAGTLTPEVEDVFARMLATDESIEQARGEAQLTPLFISAEQAAMDEQEFASYRSSVETAQEKITETVQADVFNDVMKRREASYQERRAEVRAGVERDVAEERVYKAREALSNVETPLKLSRRALVESYGTEALDKFPREFTAEDGLELQAAAEMLGYESGDELVQEVANAPEMQSVIDERTDALMTEELGDKLTNEADRHAAAQDAVNGPMREQVVQAELAALTKGQTRPGVPPVAVVRAAVERRLGITKVRNLKPGLFLMAAQRHSQKAFDLLAKGDKAGAIQAKSDELVALTFFRQSRDLQKKVESTRKRLGAYGSSNTLRQRIGLAGPDYLQQIDGLLDRYEFAKVSKKVLDHRSSLLAWATAKKANGEAVQLSEDILSEARQVNWQQLTTDELLGVADAVEHIAHLARVKNRLAKNRSAKDVDAVASDVAANIETNRRKGFTPPDEPRLPGQKGKRTITGWFAEHKKLSYLAREMDGGEDGGDVWEALVRPLNEAADREATMNAEATTRLLELFKAFKNDTRFLYRKTKVQGVAKPMSRMARIMVGLNVGNADNRQRIEDELGKQTVQAVLSSLDGTDWAFIQGVWDHLDSYWPEIAAKQERVTGVKPEKVVATEVDTRFGKLRGGYFPIKYEPLKDIKAKKHADIQEAGLDAHAAYVAATTRRGHTEARLAETHGRKLRQDFGVITEHLTQVIHDLTHHEALMDVQKVLGHDDVVKAFEQHYGVEVYDQFTSTIKDIAFGDIGTGKNWEQVLGHLRKGSSIATMAWSLTTSLQQPFGVLNATTRVGVGNLGRGLKTFWANPVKSTNEVYEKSEMMRNRGRTFQREISEIRGNIGMNDGKVASWMNDIMRKSTFGAVDQHAIAESYFFLIQKAQQAADMPTWVAGYQKAISEGKEEADAIAIADQTVLDTQGGGQVKDLASVQRGSQAFKLFTNFYSYFNVVYNQLALRTKTTKWTDPYSVGLLAADYLLLVAVPASAQALLVEYLRGDEKDDDESLMLRLAQEQLSYLMNTVVGIREASGIVQGFDYTGPAGARGFSALGQFATQATQVGKAWWKDDPDLIEKFDRAFFKSAFDVSGVFFHLPTTQVFRTLEGVIEFADGESDAGPMAIFLGPPREKR